ncbi:hypothetical protein NKDENANG_04119 [Candidatus Entotheonellaceae bacterium PAL068K]
MRASPGDRVCLGRDARGTEFGDTHAAGLECGKDGAMREVVRRHDQCLDFVSWENKGDFLELFGKRDMIHHAGRP